MTSSPNREVSSELIGSLQRSSGSFELVFGAVIASLVGFGIDKLVGTLPLFTIIFAVLGLAGAAISVIYTYRDRMLTADTERAARRQRGSA